MNETASFLIGPALRTAQRVGGDAAAPGPHVVAAAEESRPDRRDRPPPAPEPSGFRARLNYDRERAKVYVEILDPETGDVIRTLPPDMAAEEYLPLRESGSLLDNLA